MTHSKDPKDKISELRRRAESAFPAKPRDAIDISTLCTEDVQKLVHELQVHQIELEMQNDELRQAQIKLEELKDRFLDLYDFAPVGYLKLNENGLILEANLTAVRLLGEERESLIHRPFSRFVCKEDAEALYLYIKRVFERGDRQACESQIARKDGLPLHVQLEGMAIQDGAGRLVECRIAITDITERKRAADALQESEELHRLVISSISDTVLITDDRGDFTYVCPNTFVVFGYSQREVEALGNVSRLLDESLFDRSRLESLGEIRNIEATIEDKLGKEHSLLVNVKSVDIKGGTVLYTCRDITDRKRADEALREAGAFLDTLLNAIPAPVFYKGTDGRYIGFNKSYEEFFGKTQQHLVGKSVFDIAPRELAEIYHAKDLELFRNPGIQVYDSQVMDARGALHDVVLHKATFANPQGHVHGLIGVILDITDRKKAEEALKESEARVRMKLDSIIAPEGDIGTLELADVIDAKEIQMLMDDFYGLTNIGVAILDLKGNVLVATGWQDVCTKFHREHPETRRNCMASDTQLSSGIEEGEFKLYRCLNNMWDVATPIMVGGNHLGNLFLGQFLFEDEVVDHDIFRSQAKKFGFNEEQYLAALDRVPRWSRDTVDRVMRFYAKITRLLATLSFSNIKLARSLYERERLVDSLRQSEERYRAVVDNIEIGISLLNSDMQIVEVNSTLRKYFPHVRPACGQICYEQYNDPPRSEPCSYCPCVLTFQDGNVHEAITETPLGSDVRFYHLVASPIKDSQGHVQYVIELAQDITDRKKADESLKQKIDELERFNRTMVGRELRMVELKKEINELLKKAGEPEKYRTIT